GGGGPAGRGGGGGGGGAPQDGGGGGGLGGSARPPAAAGPPPVGGARRRRWAACTPPPPVAPAHSRQPRQPPRPAALGSARGAAGAGPRFIRALLGRQPLHQRQQTRPQRSLWLVSLAVALLPRRPRGAGSGPMPLGSARNPAFPAQAVPLSEDRHGHHRAAREGRLRSRGGSSGKEVVHTSSTTTARGGRQGATSTREGAPYLGEER